MVHIGQGKVKNSKKTVHMVYGWHPKEPCKCHVKVKAKAASLSIFHE